MKLEISPGSPSRLSVTEATNEVVIQKQELQVAVVTARGPQGPAFAGSTRFDLQAIDALTSSDTGKVLAWDGVQYAPTAQLDTHLTIVGGAF